MNLSLLSAIALCLSLLPPVPNYHPTYLKAKSESGRTQKSLVILFSDAACSTCEEAWKSFEKDPSGPTQYISTRVSKQDFDGKVLMDVYQPGDAPAWVIIDPNGNIKDRWTGGWKDASGNPIVLVPTSKPQPKPVTFNTSTPVASTIESNPAETKHTSTPVSTAPVVSASSTKPTTPNTHVTDGFVIQAGFFGSEENAKQTTTQLEQKGFQGFSIRQTVRDGKTFYRVISSVHPTNGDAEQLLRKLEAIGVKGAVKKTSEI